MSSVGLEKKEFDHKKPKDGKEIQGSYLGCSIIIFSWNWILLYYAKEESSFP
jgi:hypothetical protein